MKRWDVVVIGSGISSLTAAVLLAKKGKSVCVLERYRKPGGYLHCFERFGVRFDSGAHYVGAMNPGEPFHALLNYLGVYDADLFTPLDPDGFDVFHYPELTVAIPGSYEKVIERLSEQFPAEREAILKYYARVQSTVRNYQTYEYSDEIDNQELLWSLETPLLDVVSSLTRDTTLQSVLCGYVGHHGVAPHEAPFGMHALITDSFLRGAFSFRHGGEALAKNFVREIERNGGELRLGTSVTKIVTENRLATAVETADGERIEAEWIVSGIHPKLTFGLLDHPEILRPAFRERVAGLKETCGVLGVYAIGDCQKILDPNRNHFYFAQTDPAAIIAPGSPGGVPNYVFLSAASDAENPKDRPVRLNMHAVAPIDWFSRWRDSEYGRRPDDYVAFKSRCAEGVMTRVEQFHPGFRGSLGNIATSTPLSNLHFNGSPEGSPYGIYHSIANSGLRSIGPMTHLANLFLTGQSSLFPGLLGAAISGLRTAGHIVGVRSMLKEIREVRG